MFEDGIIGITFGLLALWNVNWADPFERGVAEPGLAVSLGQTFENEVASSTEFRVSYFTDRKIGPVQVMWDGSLTTKGAVFAGIGGRMEKEFDLGGVTTFAGISALIGVWERGRDADLGFPVEFRTDVELGVEIWEDARLSVVSDHRSHARLSKLFGTDDFRNRGLESVALRFTQKF